MMKHSGSCHCGAIRAELRSERQPQEQVIGACQCSFCRKHNARTFAHPKAFVTLTTHEPEHLRRYEFGLKTSEQIICGRCGVYVAMTIIDAERADRLAHVCFQLSGALLPYRRVARENRLPPHTQCGAGVFRIMLYRASGKN